MAINTAQVKELLKSNDVMAIRSCLEEISRNECFYSESASQQEQLLKLQIMLQSRIVAVLQSSNNSSGGGSGELADTYRKMASLWMRSGETERAVGQLQKALQLDPNNEASLQLLARAQLNQSYYDKAIATQEKAIEAILSYCTDETVSSSSSSSWSRADKLAMANVQLASIYEVKGEFQQAIAILKKTAAMNHPNNDAGVVAAASDLNQAEVYFKLGVICEKIGQDQDAIEYLSKAHVLFQSIHGDAHPKTQEIAYLLEMAQHG